MRFMLSRWRLFQYRACWRNSWFSACRRWTRARSSSTSGLKLFTGKANSGRKCPGRQTCYQLAIHDQLGLTEIAASNRDFYCKVDSNLEPTSASVNLLGRDFRNSGGGRNFPRPRPRNRHDPWIRDARKEVACGPSGGQDRSSRGPGGTSEQRNHRQAAIESLIILL